MCASSNVWILSGNTNSDQIKNTVTGISLSYVEYLVLIGVTFDKSLTFKPHVLKQR